jgi:cobalt-zinc-cadmium efflux system protein
VHDHRDHAVEQRAVRSGLALTTALAVGELAGGWWTNSLSLATDGLHVVADAAALALTYFALWIGQRPADAAKTFGYHRAEILAAFVNGVTLCVLVAFVVVAALGRVVDAPPMAARGALMIGVLGLLINLVVAWRLHAHQHRSLNLRGAYLHVVSDVLGSVGAVAAAGIVWATGWSAADGIASLLIAGLVLRTAWQLVREAVDVLMEAVPAHIDVAALRGALEGVPGTREVHDLHVWTLTTGRHALSAHAVVDQCIADDDLLAAMAAVCAREFHIDHVTIQIEHQSRLASEPSH